MTRFPPLLLLLLCPACGTTQWYPPPAQQTAFGQPATQPFGHFVAMSDPHAGAYIVQGFRDNSEGTWRWAHEHPVLRFWLPPVAAVRFSMDLALPDATFHQTGPVTLTIAINGRPFDRVRYDRPGAQHYSKTAPLELLHLGGVNSVAIDPDKCATREGGERLGFVLTGAGFVE